MLGQLITWLTDFFVLFFWSFSHILYGYVHILPSLSSEMLVDKVKVC